MSTPAIKVDNISYAYGEIEAVSGISFEVAPWHSFSDPIHDLPSVIKRVA